VGRVARDGTAIPEWAMCSRDASARLIDYPRTSSYVCAHCDGPAGRSPMQWSPGVAFDQYPHEPDCLVRLAQACRNAADGEPT